MPDQDPESPRDNARNDAAGFATRAIRAAHRLPLVDQRPTSVPIYQTVTFSSADAEELGAVLTGRTPGVLTSRADATRAGASHR